jgi:tRNA A-37 threonylcarbamoyl transferase component Bud32
MSGRWGNMDKKKIVHVLDNGLGYVRDSLRDKSMDVNTAQNHYEDLKKLLYNEGRDLLSMSNKVRFESKLRTIKKLIEKENR